VREVAQVILARAERVTLLHEAVALRYEFVLEMPQHLLGAHTCSTSQEEVGAQHRILCGHRVLQLSFCEQGGGLSGVGFATLLLPSLLLPTLLSSLLPPTKWVGPGGMG
jgi:hypothetical protein